MPSVNRRGLRLLDKRPRNPSRTNHIVRSSMPLHVFPLHHPQNRAAVCVEIRAPFDTYVLFVNT